MLSSFFWSGDAIRSRRISDVVLTGTLDVPEPPARLLADWARETSTRMLLEPGDVEPMPLARSIMRWPDYARCGQAMSAWMDSRGLPGVLAESDIALMACRGARYHHDGAQYGHAAFCNLFMSEDKGLDLHFPALDLLIPLTRGTAVLFDTGQPHGVVRRGSRTFDVADFAPQQDWVQIFLTWELSIEDPHVARALDVKFDIASPGAQQPNEEEVCLDGERVDVQPDSGRWFQIGPSGARTR